ncbi:TIGR02453 family protein [Bacteroidia bacterium]|nr:TIGR02453 family protein [Bacteroidia bacterium]
MQTVIHFLTQLQNNNNREWFEANKAWYKQSLEAFNTFAEKLIAGIAQFDDSVQGLTIKDCTYRIYRDLRFTPNKLEPYKTHIGVYVAHKGKNAGYAGYYFHVEPAGGRMIGNNILTAGLYMPEPKVLQIVREDIDNQGEQFVELLQKAKGFQLDDGEGHKLKRVPRGFNADSKYADYLKLKDFYVAKYIDNDYLLRADLLENVLKEYRKTTGLVAWLNRAVDFAHNE